MTLYDCDTWRLHKSSYAFPTFTCTNVWQITLSPTYEYSWAILHRDWSTPHRAVPSFHAVDRFLTSSGVSRLTRGVSVYWHMLINIHDADGGRQSIAPCSWRHSWRITAVTGDSYLRIMRIYSLNSINNLLLNYLWTSKHTYEWNLVTFEPTNNRILQYYNLATLFVRPFCLQCRLDD